MPGTYTYPGVYIEELPSGVRTITGVSTSNTAFIDFFKYGPVNKAVRITSYGDFERIFGGLDVRSEASYAIRQYYLNGGQIGWVVRVIDSATAKAANITLTGSSPPQPVMTLTAASAGIWGNDLQVGVDYNTFDRNTVNAKQFNLIVRQLFLGTDNQKQVLVSEVYRNLEMDSASPRYVVDVVNKESNLVQVSLPTSNPPVPRVRPLFTGGTASVDIVAEATNPKSTAFKPFGINPSQTGIDGTVPGETSWDQVGPSALKSGLTALDRIAPEIFNLMSIPAAANFSNANSQKDVFETAAKYCEDKRAVLIVDLPESVDTQAEVLAMAANLAFRNAAIYYPRLLINDPLKEGRSRNVGPSGTIAGVYARTDATRGVWKAPAGTEAELRGATPALPMLDLENGGLNPYGVNALRSFPIFGSVVWGARTLYGADQRASEWKYIPVRRTALYIEESLYQALKWVVFEPNDEPLWSQIRLNVGAFMQTLFRQGAFQGKSPREAYLVKCDRETTTQTDINMGVVNIVVGFAPLKPAEFVVVKIQQIAGQIEV